MTATAPWTPTPEQTDAAVAWAAKFGCLNTLVEALNAQRRETERYKNLHEICHEDWKAIKGEVEALSAIVEKALHLLMDGECSECGYEGEEGEEHVEGCETHELETRYNAIRAARK